ncbi:TIR-like protein FxsC [Streptomyces sp. NPDC051921]|uniref:TIR-like protein FxsC n=1 Tax=Streptomyces sp. NPDC051921 TaxID=3155806 RepID=UPI0034182E88
MQASPWQRAADQRPYFFLSYAHSPRLGAGGPDPDMWVERLFRDLCGHVMAMTDAPAGVPVGFMDRAVRPGDGGAERVAEALATCRVFVPLLSPRYFASEACGKEWYAFAQRASFQQARSGRPVEAIVPAVWVPVPASQLPGPVERLQFDHRAFGDRYVTDGLYGLVRLRAYAEEYERTVYEIAKRIVSVAESAGLEPGRPLDDRQTPSAFGPPGGGPARRLQVTVAAPARQDLPRDRDPEYYGDSPLSWNPYYPESVRPLAHVAQDLGRALNYETSVVSFDDAGPRKLEQPSLGPEILLVDRWALYDERRRARLAAFDAEHRSSGSVIVPWNRLDRQSRAREAELSGMLETTMPVKLGQGRAVSRAAAGGVPSLEAFARILPHVVEAAARQLLRHATVYPPAAGSVVERPRLRGPMAADGAGTPFTPEAHDIPKSLETERVDRVAALLRHYTALEIDDAAEAVSRGIAEMFLRIGPPPTTAPSRTDGGPGSGGVDDGQRWTPVETGDMTEGRRRG